MLLMFVGSMRVVVLFLLLPYGHPYVDLLFSPIIKRQTFAPHPSTLLVCLCFCVDVFVNLLDLCVISGRLLEDIGRKTGF